MESEKVKEIKKALEQMTKAKYDRFAYKDNDKFGVILFADILTLINELESENERLKECYKVKAYDKLRAENKQLRTANKLYAVELGKKGKQEYENIITDVRIDTLKDFREKYKEALKQEVNGENVDCFVESLKIFDKTLKEFTNEQG